MRSRFLKYIAFVMALVLVLSSLIFLPVGAQSEERYFIFDRLEDANGGSYMPTASQLSLSLTPAVSFHAVGLSLLSEQSNAFLVSLQNNSNAKKLCISYTYQVAGTSATEVIEKEIASHTDRQVLVLPAAHIASGVQSLSVFFTSDAPLSGSVVLHGLLDISTYVSTVQNEIALSRCHFISESNELHIEGSLSYAATVRYEGETLALFAIGEGDDLHLSGKTPLARTDISFHFSFTVPISRSDELFKRYVVAAITSTGERVPLCTPTYPSLPATASVAAQGFKGYHSEDFGRVMDNLPDFGVVDVQLDRLFGTQNNGILYAGQYDYYYFDLTYLTEIERRVRNLDGVGANVYLRLLVGNSRENISFADEAPAGVTNRLAVLRNESAQRDLYAVIDFLTGRFQQGSEISGLILGRSADRVSQYSYCDATTLAQYTALYASTFNLIAGVARRNIPTLRVLLPLSDNIWDGNGTTLQQSKDFSVELFLPSLLSALEAQVLEPQSFELMLESAAFSDRVGGVDASHIGIDRLNTFLANLTQMATKHPYLSHAVFFSWQPASVNDMAKLHADYLLKYITLSQKDSVHAFLLDFSAAEVRGEDGGAQALDHLARYINTNRLPEAAQLALSALGMQSLEQLYADAAKIIDRRVYRTDLSADGYVNTTAVKGSFALWSFSAADDALGWYEGTACNAFSVSFANQSEHTLVAQFTGDDRYGEIAYHFDAPVNLSFAPLFVMPLAVKGVAGTRYELQLRLIAESTVTYASFVMNEGEGRKLYLDLSEAPFALSDLRAIRVMVRPLDGANGDFSLHFGGMTVQSATLDDKELAERVSAIWQSSAQDGETKPARDYTVPLLVTAIVVVISIGACTLLILNYKRKKKRNLKRP